MEAEQLALFRVYRDVQYCTLVMDRATGRSQSYGVVEMPRAGEARVAIKGLDARAVGGGRIRVKKAKDRGEGGAGKGPGTAGS